MTGSNNLHVRKGRTIKAQKPAPLRRLSGPVVSPKSSPGLAGPKRQQEKDQAGMAVSFLNFCATCENQINVPNNSILYCSEACRRKDSAKPLSMSLTAMDLPSTPPADAPSRAILPLLAPSASPNVSASQFRIPPDQHDAKSDLDPTEWKPKLGRPRPMSTKSANSPAYHFLSQFHRSTSNCAFGEEKSTLKVAHGSTLSMTSLSSAPSLSASPETASSSMNSPSPVAASYTFGCDYDFSTRALPPRHNPEFSSSFSKGIDLVTPHCVPAQASTGKPIPEPCFQGGIWEKKPVKGKIPSANASEGLSALFGRSIS